MTTNQTSTVARNVGAGLFLLWSVLHIYVGVSGLIAFLTGTPATQFQMLFGGANAPGLRSSSLPMP